MATKKNRDNGRKGKTDTSSSADVTSPAGKLASEREAAAGKRRAVAVDGQQDIDAEPAGPEPLSEPGESLTPKAPEPSADVASQTPPRHEFPVVGIGASAGGLEALQEFFSRVPAKTGMAFVVVTHQHPGHVSLLPALLGKSTDVPVVEACDGLVVEPDHVYVGPPGGLLSIAGGVLHWMSADVTKIPHLPIDHFFRSLALDQRELAICVVLSGTGTDGTLGMRAVKAESGLAVVQETSSAKYSGMPTSASATGLADYVLPAAQMVKQLIAYIRGPYLKTRPPAFQEPVFPKEPLQRIMALLRSRTGHDFSLYKKSTILRRIERRMNVHQIKEPHDYVRYLQENSRELDLLFSEVLISVTSFFRDPQAFEVLAKRVIPDLMQSRNEEHVMRVWVAGCATGEEAYSVAMTMRECMEERKKFFEVQVFATDLDAHAIDTARLGLYSGGITADVSKERLERFFTIEDTIYRVRKEIREMLVFAAQNVIKDPPFTKLDLVVCRNLLIYLDVELQRRLLPIFHYALRPGGVLFLGPSESIGGFGDWFETLDGKWKIFRRKEVSTNVHPLLELPSEPVKHHAEGTSTRELLPAVKQSHTVTQIERMLLARFAPVNIVCDERGNIVYIHGRTGAYLEPVEGQPRHNLLEMARHGLVRPLTAAIRKVVAKSEEVIREHVRVKTNGDFTHVGFSVSRIGEPESIRGLLLVTIHPSAAVQPAAAGSASKTEEAQPDRGHELEEELWFAKDSLQSTIEELETSNEELKSTNEELQSTNEELQSTNEELETSKEEMQSLNEELSTVNAELQGKVDELSHATDDMQNLLNSTQVATIFLGNQLDLKRYTEQARELINLIPTDIGRPLSDLTTKFDYPRLIDDCREVSRTLARKEVELRDRNGRWHLLRIMPYRTAQNVIDGVVLTFVEINRLKEAEQRAAGVWRCFADILDAAREPMVLLDSQQRVVTANERFCRAFSVTMEQAEGKSICELDKLPGDNSQLRELLRDVVERQAVVSDFPLVREYPGGQSKQFLLNARRLNRVPADSAGTIIVSVCEAEAEKTA